MPNREEMQNLAHQIIGAYDHRVKGIGELKAAMRAQLQEFDSVHQAMAREMRADLARDHADRQAAVGAELAGFHSAHQAMAREMRADLARDHADRQATVGAQIAGFHSDHQAMASSLRSDLSRGRADLRATVGAQMAALRKEQAGGRSEWRNMVTAMRARRGRPAKTSMARPKAPAAPMAEEDRELTALRSRVFAYLANHPDGARLVEMEGEMGVSRFQMSRVLKSLMDDKKVEKRDLRYFAV